MAETATDGAWDEARLEQAMERLKLLHIKVRMLRDTIPKMVDPLVQKQPSPDAMFAAFQQAVSEAQADVTQFKQLMKDGTSQEVFDRAEKSRQENPLGIKPWTHKDHPDWFKLNADK